MRSCRSYPDFALAKVKLASVDGSGRSEGNKHSKAGAMALAAYS